MTLGTSNRHRQSPGTARIRARSRHWLRARWRDGGFILLELILATILFSVAVVGLARATQYSVHDLAALNRENDIRVSLRSFLEEVRRKPITEMSMDSEDERLGVTFSSKTEELTLKNVNGTVLKDLYKLTVTATVKEQTNEEPETIEVWVYKPQTEPK